MIKLDMDITQLTLRKDKKISYVMMFDEVFANKLTGCAIEIQTFFINDDSVYVSQGGQRGWFDEVFMQPYDIQPSYDYYFLVPGDYGTVVIDDLTDSCYTDSLKRLTFMKFDPTMFNKFTVYYLAEVFDEMMKKG